VNQAPRDAVVTGTSSGIGRATALRLAEDGWHVFAGVRRPADGESLRRAARSGAEITPLLMDVTDADQIKLAAATVDEHVGPAGLTALVDNAGIGVAWAVELVPLDALRWQFEVNVFGQVGMRRPLSTNSPADGAALYRDSYLGMLNAALARGRRGSPPTVVADLVAKVLTTQRPGVRHSMCVARWTASRRNTLATTSKSLRRASIRTPPCALRSTPSASTT
jgi:NAD(P)-dependent dehydrogenase (short-subunit alcohol dehydrogenase family)